MIVTFDVGGTSLRSARVVERGRAPTGKRRRATPHGDVTALVAALADEVGAHADAAGEAPAVIGLAIAGMLDLPRGRVIASPGLGLVDADLAGPLADAVGARVRLVNDVNAAAAGEAAAADVDDLCALFVGTGVGTGIVTGGRLVEGARGMAAEGGHVRFRGAGGRRCRCGEVGCFEAYLGGGALAERAREAGIDGGAEALFAAARAGEARARPIVDEAFEAVSTLAGTLAVLLDPRRLVVGGSVGLGVPEVLEAARTGARARVPSLEVEPARLGDDAGLVGAARLAELHLGAADDRREGEEAAGRSAGG